MNAMVPKGRQFSFDRINLRRCWPSRGRGKARTGRHIAAESRSARGTSNYRNGRRDAQLCSDAGGSLVLIPESKPFLQ